MSDGPEDPILLATIPPGRAQRRRAVAAAVVLAAAYLATAPFATIQLPRVDAFIPAVQTALVITALITAVLLFAQFYIVRWRALLALAAGYLGMALIVIPQTLTFPGVFAPIGRLAGPQTAAWIYYVWHVLLPLAVIVYVLQKPPERAPSLTRRSARDSIAATIAVVVLLVGGLTWVATAGSAFLPELVVDMTLSPLAGWLAAAESLLTLGALALLWRRQRSVLDLWLAVALFASLPDITVAALFPTSRFSLGWYAARGYALAAGTVVLLVLLSETTALYVRLARANLALRREREARLLTIESLMAAIAHEINQPLTGLITTAQASKRLLARTPPDLAEIRGALEDIVVDGRRVADTISGIRAIIGRDRRQMTEFPVNDVVQQVLRSLDVELRARRVSVSARLGEALPSVHGNRVLVEHVLINLITNAIEAMEPLPEPERLLRIGSTASNGSGISVTVEDSGPGISTTDEGAIFEPFFTTKPNGVGMGLAICRSIIELHDGKLWMSHGQPRGTIFHVELPGKNRRAEADRASRSPTVLSEG